MYRRFLTVFVALVLASLVSAQVTFQGIGFMSLDNRYSDAMAVSGDGSTVVGSTTDADNNVWSYRWTLGGGMQILPALGSDGMPYSVAFGVSASGAVVVGQDYSADGPLIGYRWTQAGGMETIPNLPGDGGYGSANGVSADGAIVAGDGYDPLRWTAGTGSVALPLFTTGFAYNTARGISADGSTIVGTASRVSDSANRAARWTVQGGNMTIDELDVSPDTQRSDAYAASLDGSVIVGSYFTAAHPGEIAYAWQSGTALSLDSLSADPNAESVAHGVSADGSWIVGHSDGLAVLWNAAGDVFDLNTYLTTYSGLNLAGWTLEEATGISADGLTIVGNGLNPDGDREGWVAHIGTAIPEPSTYALLSGVLMLGLAAWRRRQAA